MPTHPGRRDQDRGSGCCVRPLWSQGTRSDDPVQHQRDQRHSHCSRGGLGSHLEQIESSEAISWSNLWINVKGNSPRGTWKGRSSGLRHSSQIQGKSWRTRYPPR